MPCAFISVTTAFVISSVGKNQLTKLQLSPAGSGILPKGNFRNLCQYIF